ncbi:MAG: translation initiation factor IF-2 [Gammaproteobacteria bacterium]|nr:MAG: translation initiation factor IF-2 [Pseudomonadota bacterium]MBC6943878.1 translation initiation factor IF-2 [Gammaproteobacteria bacterium]MCE7895318.1 translation initiation factor IF-2 [Gammaproteobacteria bacterium PRO8]MDL1880194.1 translation initiation factor IF-2 [Gammaproteobacteria bacterium PRO2]MCL4776184.1 translation initiation factor IF-2 [Gammaproteobacteria bacterium]
MSDVTVAQFAEVLKVPVERLLVQLDEAGISVSGADAVISDDAKMELLTHLRKSHGHAEENSTGGAPKKITLKRRTQSEIRLASNQGRARTVNVEIRRKRTYVKRDELEKEARQQQEEVDRKRREEEESRLEKERLERAEQERVEQERRERELREQEAARLKAEEEAKAAEEARRQKEARKRETGERERATEDIRSWTKVAAEPERAPVDDKSTRYGRQELHVTSDISGRRKKKRPARRGGAVTVDSRHGFERPTAPVIRAVEIPESIKVSELAQRMAVKGGEVIKVLMKLGTMATINQVIDQDTATLVVEEMGHTPKAAQSGGLEAEILASVGVAGDLRPRPPVVTIMGHVDHGKTSLLDFIRSTKVAAGEAGGITQHIGAYRIETPNGQIAFLDTPGHEAFTAMRARGAKVTDIVVLVVAADDGVKPQTEEAIQHARAAGVPIVVAINKIDKSDADPERVRNELVQRGVVPEEWGGETLFVNVSARTGAGVDKLLESLLLQAELLDLKAPGEGPATGVVIESGLEKGRGAVATVLVTGGRLRQGDVLLAGQEYGRVRVMYDAAANPVKEAGASTPVVVLGLSGIPAAGDDAVVLPDERQARELSDLRKARTRDTKLAQQQSAKLEDVFSQLQSGVKSVQLLIKADVHGSAEALRDALAKLATSEIQVKVIGSSVGGITESDVNLAAASGATIIGFNVRADGAARDAIKATGVDVRYYSIIYQAIDDVRSAMTGMLAPEIRDQIVGLAEVRDVFRSPKFGSVAGCLVVDGYVKRSNPVRVLRDHVVIFEGELDSLRRFKDDVSEVRAGTECGIGVRNYSDVKVGDQIECFERVQVARSL